MDPAKEARAVLDVMAQSLLDDPSMPTPAPLQTPPADVIRALMSGNIAGQAIGKGNSAEVHACQSNPRFVIRTVRQQDEVEWQRELSRLRRVPALSVITTVFATSGRSSLMPRLWPIPRGALRTTEIIRLKYDISAALEMLHRSHIVHADIHAENLMLRAEPPCFVLIDYSGCTGDSVYPLHLGYGAFGYGGATHRPPTLESSPAPVRTAHGDYYRLASTILKQLHIGPEPSKRKHSDKDNSLPSHLDKELRLWLERDQWPRPPSPTSPFPPGSWKDTAVSPSIILHASLWRANGQWYPGAGGRCPRWVAGNRQLGELRDFGTILPEMPVANLRAFCSHHLPGDLPLAGLFQSGRLPRPGQPAPSSPAPPDLCGVFDC